MHMPVGTLRTRALAMPKACREPFAVIYGARNGTSHSARNSCLSDQSLAQHQNASRQAVYGPGVAAQVNSFLTRALGIPKRTLGCLRTRKMLATHGTIDSARSSRAHHRPLIDLNDHDECCIGPKCKWRVHAHTHENASCAWFDHSHTRPKACRAPFGWGSNRQAKRCANHLGQTRELLAQETEHIGGRRQTGILTR